MRKESATDPIEQARKLGEGDRIHFENGTTMIVETVYNRNDTKQVSVRGRWQNGEFAEYDGSFLELYADSFEYQKFHFTP